MVDKRSAFHSAAAPSESGAALLATDETSVQSSNAEKDEAISSLSPSANQEVEQRAAATGSAAAGSDDVRAVVKPSEQSTELPVGFSKSTRLKPQPLAEEEAAPPGSRVGALSNGVLGGDATSSGAAGLQRATGQRLTACAPSADSAASGSMQRAKAETHDSDAAIAALLAPQSGVDSLHGAYEQQGLAAMPLRQQADVQLHTLTSGAEERAATKQQLKEKQQSTTKQKHAQGHGDRPMAEDTPEMRSQFVKQLLISAFDMDRQW